MKIGKRKYFEQAHDFIVVGGGMTGVCAALSAARNGLDVALVHDRPVLGGNASSEIRMHICGANANMQKPELTESGIVHELILANKKLNDSHNFSIWDAVLFDAIKKEKNITLYLNTTMLDVSASENTVKEIECYQLTTEKRIKLSARFFADCTGNGSLCAFSGAEFRIGTEGKDEFNEPHAPEKATNDRMGNTLLFKAVDKGHPVEFVPPVKIIHFTEEQLKYRKHCAAIPEETRQKSTPEELERLFGGFCPDYGYWWIEIPGEKENIIEEYEDIRDQLVSAVYGIWDHIKNGGDHGAENYELAWVGMLPGTRESRRIECDYMLNERDVLENRRFDDKVAYGGWWVDNHFGLFAFDHVPSFTFGFDGSYDIPYRSYCVKNFTNLFVGGRCMGATKFAMASTRVIATCAVGGQAIGTAAALLCKSNANDIRNIDITKLQQTLIKDDCYLPLLLNNDNNDLARTSVITASSEADGYGVSNIISGITRRIDNEAHFWKSDSNSSLPHWLRFKLKTTSKISTVQITFDSNLEIEKKITMSSRRQNQQVPGVPKELVRDYKVTLIHNGKEVSSQKISGNFQRVNRICFDSILCDTVKIDMLTTNGDTSAKVFEVRIYEN